ncbi:MAG: N-acetylneuraminate synthase family protein [bacterium]
MKPIKIGNKTIGETFPVFIIAEIGSNHDGKLEQAKKLIKAAADAGADAVKFQSFSAEGLLNPLRLENKKWVPHPAYPIIKKLEMPDEWHKPLFDYAQKCGVIFLSAAFDSRKANLLNKLDVPVFKIASGDLTDLPLIKLISGFKKPMILSTGAAYLSEVKEAISIIKKVGNNNIILLQCAALYPPKFSDSNIRAMVTLEKTFHLYVGYSDHTPGYAVPLGAVALGAKIIEKHITFSRKLKGPDHPYAMEIKEFKKMVDDIRNLEQALGSGKKEPARSEMPERIGARKSLYATKAIKKGSTITKEMIKTVRHAYGLPPKMISSVVGKKAKHNIKKNELIRL